MNFGLGDFRFSVPTFTVDEINEKTGGRVAKVEVMGSAPITQLLGPDSDTLEFSTTYFPLHMNPGGNQLLTLLRAVCRAQTPLPLIAVSGLVGEPLGRWIVESVDNGRSQISPAGPQVITASISLLKYVAQGQSSLSLGFIR